MGYSCAMLDRILFLIFFSICFGIGGVLVWLVAR
jgi:hypothetical protein